MFVVIFRAEIGQLDKDYLETAEKMRDIAINRYHCIEFTALTEGKQEIALSYWHKEADILKWKQDAQHLIAQKYGQEKWYRSYRVEITQIKRRYDFPK